MFTSTHHRSKVSNNVGRAALGKGFGGGGERQQLPERGFLSRNKRQHSSRKGKMTLFSTICIVIFLILYFHFSNTGNYNPNGLYLLNQNDDGDSTRTSNNRGRIGSRTERREQQQPLEEEKEFIIPRIPIMARRTQETRNIQETPILITEWDIPYRPKEVWGSKESFINKFGSYIQYIKGIDVQPLKNKVTNEYCKATIRDLLNIIQIQKSISKTSPEKQQQRQQVEKQLLFFTNSNEHAKLFQELNNDYSFPTTIASTTTSNSVQLSTVAKDIFTTVRGFQFLSILNENDSHPFHKHDATYIGQIVGRKLWFFLPPTFDTRKFPLKKENACIYYLPLITNEIFNHQQQKGIYNNNNNDSQQHGLPDGTIWMIQNPGDIMYLPKYWYHATCALPDDNKNKDDHWNVAIGAQNGNPAYFEQNFEPLDHQSVRTSSTANYEQYLKEMEQCEVISSSTVQTLLQQQNANNNNNKKIQPTVDENGWKWYDGDINEYYNKLEKDIHDRNPDDINTFAVHRWLGNKKSTQEHYNLIHNAINQYYINNNNDPTSSSSNSNVLKLLDAGCGLGAGIFWFHNKEKNWKLHGRTISEDQYNWIKNKLLPKIDTNINNPITVELKSYDDLDSSSNNQYYDIIYSIEALIHSRDLRNTLKVWSNHVMKGSTTTAAANNNGGLIIVIDDFLSNKGVEAIEHDNNNEEVKEDLKLFRDAWLANSFVSVNEFVKIAKEYGNLDLIEDLDVGKKFNVIKLNYRNTIPQINDKRKHQGWLGGKVRHKLTVQGYIEYHMLVFRLSSDNNNNFEYQPRRLESNSPTAMSLPVISLRNDNYDKNDETHEVCEKVLTTRAQQQQEDRQLEQQQWEIEPVLMSGIGKNGGQKIGKCISGWYCCGKGQEYHNHLEEHRTDNTGYLKLPKELFGFYLDSFAKHLSEFYSTLLVDPTISLKEESGYNIDQLWSLSKNGKFLDIGGTGNVASGMKQVTTKFTHFAGPLDYLVLDVDEAAKKLNNAIVCNIDDCPETLIGNCTMDVTFSHTVLEHSKHPWKAFDTISRITKSGGLSLHLVPFSYQFHATPEDHFRFSHTGLASLLEERDFNILDIGYDICMQPEKMKTNHIDEHYEVIWLTYVVAQKK